MVITKKIIEQQTRFFIDPAYRIYRYVALALIIFITIFPVYHTDYGKHIGLDYISVMSLVSLCFYFSIIIFNLKLLIPKFLLQDKAPLYLLLFLSTMFMLTLLQVTSAYCIENGLNKDGLIFVLQPGCILYLIVLFCINCFIFAGLSFTILLQQWINGKKELESLDKQYMLSELNELKNRIRPDFLFNMLNKSSIAATTDPEFASSLIFRLSNVLRYQLYDSKREKVFLLSDISFMENYLEAEKISSGSFNFNITKNGNMEGILIPALIFMPVTGRIMHCFNISEYNHGNYINVNYNFKNNILSYVCSVKSSVIIDIKDEMLYRAIKLIYGPACEVSAKVNHPEYIIDIRIWLQ